MTQYIVLHMLPVPYYSFMPQGSFLLDIEPVMKIEPIMKISTVVGSSWFHNELADLLNAQEVQTTYCFGQLMHANSKLK